MALFEKFPSIFLLLQPILPPEFFSLYTLHVFFRCLHVLLEGAINGWENPKHSTDGMLRGSKGAMVIIAYMHVNISFSAPECNGKQCFI